MSSKLIPAGDAALAAASPWRPARDVLASTSAPAVRSLAPRGAGAADPEFDAKIKAAYQQGRAEAEAAATQQALAKIEPVVASLGHIVQELTATRKTFRAAAEQDTVKLSIAIARRVLYRELATDPDAILGLVIAAFQKLNARETHRLRVAPSDAAAIHQHRARLDLPSSLEVLADASLVSGSAVFETSRGELDASVDTQLAEIDRGFADIVRRRVR